MIQSSGCFSWRSFDQQFKKPNQYTNCVKLGIVAIDRVHESMCVPRCARNPGKHCPARSRIDEPGFCAFVIGQTKKCAGTRDLDAHHGMHLEAHVRAQTRAICVEKVE
ncbi:hypothetical protein F6X39_21810 [Paraburkholderia sp. UCT2]|nr:hypothetical protein [Paraburkholderia sp. UCT2]